MDGSGAEEEINKLTQLADKINHQISTEEPQVNIGDQPVDPSTDGLINDQISRGTTGRHYIKLTKLKNQSSDLHRGTTGKHLRSTSSPSYLWNYQPSYQIFTEEPQVNIGYRPVDHLPMD